MYGRWTVLKLYRSGRKSEKIKVCEALAPSRRELEGTKWGTAVMRECGVDMFRNRRHAWEAGIDQAVSRKDAMASILGSGSGSSRSGGSGPAGSAGNERNPKRRKTNGGGIAGEAGESAFSEPKKLSKKQKARLRKKRRDAAFAAAQSKKAAAAEGE